MPSPSLSSSSSSVSRSFDDSARVPPSVVASFDEMDSTLFFLTVELSSLSVPLIR